MSDTQGGHSGFRPSTELQELMSRVASLEAQLKSSKLEGKGQPEEGKCATWPGWVQTLFYLESAYSIQRSANTMLFLLLQEVQLSDPNTSS